MFIIHITDIAEQDVQDAYQWWQSNRSPDEAARWLDAIYPAISTLATMPRRCSLAHEKDVPVGELRQLLFGVGRRVTHRILFTIEGETVYIVRIRHVSQQEVLGDNIQ